MVAPTPSDSGSTNISALKLSAIWWPATATIPSGETSSATTANSVTSKNSASATGMPMPIRRFSAAQSGPPRSPAWRLMSRCEGARFTYQRIIRNMIQ